MHRSVAYDLDHTALFVLSPLSLSPKKATDSKVGEVLFYLCNQSTNSLTCLCMTLYGILSGSTLLSLSTCG